MAKTAEKKNRKNTLKQQTAKPAPQPGKKPAPRQAAKPMPQPAADRTAAVRDRRAQEDRNACRKLLLLFVIAFLVHTLLNIAVNEAPKVVIDEGLYTNIARSLAWDGELAFRGQPVNYPYLLYPFLLVPVYWLNRLTGGDVYRFVQVFNTLLVTSSVFPAFLFARDFTKNDAKALATAVLVAILPDMLTGGFEMTECLIWPLSLWMAFFCLRFYSERRTADGLLTALFAGLMFACKPGAIAMGLVLLLFALITGIKDRKQLTGALLSLGALLAVVAAVYAVYLALNHHDSSLLGLYEKQTAEWKSGDTLVAAEAFFLLTFLFIFACGGIFALFPYTHLGEYDRDRRRFVIAAAGGVLAAVAGTAVFVVPYKWTGELGKLPLHLRYCSMYVPLMYVFTADICDGARKSRGYAAGLAAFIVLSLFPGARAGFVPGKSGSIDSLALNAFATTRKLNGTVTGWIVTALVVVFSLVFLLDAAGWKPSGGKRNGKLFSLASAFFAVFILFNSVCAHINASIYIDPKITADAAQVNRIIGSGRCLGITQRYYDDYYSYWLDSRLNVPMQQVTIDQMYVEMDESGGVYRPFIPVDQAPNENNHETPDTDTFVLGMTIAEHLELSDGIVSAEKTENGHFTVVRIDPAHRWVDTMIYGLDDDSLYSGSTGLLRVFDSGRNVDGLLKIKMNVSGDGALLVGGERLALESGKNTFELELPFAETVSLAAEGGTVQIHGYSTQKGAAN